MDTKLEISLPQPLMEWLERRAANAGFDTKAAVVEDLIRQEQEREQRVRLERHLLDILEGPAATPMTNADWQKIRDDGMRRLGSAAN